MLGTLLERRYTLDQRSILLRPYGRKNAAISSLDDLQEALSNPHDERTDEQAASAIHREQIGVEFPR